MHQQNTALQNTPVYGLAALTAGILYTSRWIWELTEGILKNKHYSPTVVTQNFFLVKCLFILALAGLLPLLGKDKMVRRGLFLACLGLTWTAVSRTLEAYGAPGPWGFYSSPGLLLFFAGCFAAGFFSSKSKQCLQLSKCLSAIAVFYFIGGASSMLLFNLLGRTESANAIASAVANCFLIAEGISWMLLGLFMLVQKREVSLFAGVKKSL